MTNTYDEANQQEFDEHTKAINAALYKIESNPDLKPTIAQVVKLTGLHRNTISNRGWPSTRLHEIKEDRHQQKLKSKQDAKHQQDVNELLEQALNELLYWHHLASEKEEEISSLRRLLSLKSESMEFYKSETSSLRLKNQELVAEHNRLRDLLS